MVIMKKYLTSDMRIFVESWLNLYLWYMKSVSMPDKIEPNMPENSNTDTKYEAVIIYSKLLIY